jgi:hypothetical protein
MMARYDGLIFKIRIAARSKAKLDFHFKASLRAVNMAKLEARQQRGDSDDPMSMASLKRRAFNICSIEFVST